MATRYSKLITNYIYLYHTDKFIIIPEYPENINDTKTSSFAETNALSRSNPVFSYNYSAARSINVNLSLHRDMMNDINLESTSSLSYDLAGFNTNVVDFKSEDYVDRLIAELQSIALPRYNAYANGSKSVIPPMVAIRFGNEIFIKGVVNSAVNVTYGKPILANGKYAKVDISFNVSEVDPYDADTVAQEGSFRGIASAFSSSTISSFTNNSSSNLTSTVSNGANTVEYVKHPVVLRSGYKSVLENKLKV